MKKIILQSAAVVLLSTLNFQLSTVFAQGSLTPPGAPAPVMKTLAQIEPRTAITNTGAVTIAASGSYYLTTNLTVSSGDAITITANNVTLDLNGFTITSTAASAAGTAVLLSGGRTNVSIANGQINSSVTNSPAGGFGGGGFNFGITYSGFPSNARVKNVSITGVLNSGILISTGNSTVVEACTVNVAGSYGILADSVSDSTVINCGGVGIQAGTAHNCTGSGVGSGIGLSATAANNCLGTSSGSGAGLTATTANNCTGTSAGNGTGLSAVTANNCLGTSAGNGTGLNASAVATGCYGISFSGTGLNAFIASVCHGTTTSGTALTATHNVNSF